MKWSSLLRSAFILSALFKIEIPRSICSWATKGVPRYNCVMAALNRKYAAFPRLPESVGVKLQQRIFNLFSFLNIPETEESRAMD